jgi:hypothetical protein
VGNLNRYYANKAHFWYAKVQNNRTMSDTR